MQGLILLSVISWLACFFIDSGSNINYCRRGGGGTPEQSPPPAAPSPTETSRQAIDAQIEAIPRQLEAQKEFGPQFTQQSLDELREFAPQFAQEGLELAQQFGVPLAEQTRAEQEVLAPERVAGSEAVTDFINQGPDQLTPEEIREIEQSARSAAAARGLESSGFSAQDEILKLFQVRQGLKNRFLDVSLSASGRLPAAGGSTVSPSPASVSQPLVQNVNPNTFFGGQQAQNASNASIYGTQSQAFTAQRGQNLSLVGDVVGGLAGGVGAYYGAKA